MLFTFGTGFYGKVANHNGHWIETKCFHIMFLPLFPVNSMYVTDAEFRSRQGFEISLHTQSVIAIYARLFSGMLAAFMLYTMYSDSQGEGLSYTTLLITIASVTVWFYFCFYYGKASEEDIAIRDKVSSLTGLYALPHWFEHTFLWKMLELYSNKYKLLYPESDWKADLNKTGFNKERCRLLYGVALFNCMINNSPENDELYVKADNLYAL